MPRRGILLLALLGVAGLLLLIAAVRFERPALIGPGLLLFAAGILATGAETIVTRYTRDRNRETAASQVFVGPAAVLIGVVLVVLGLALAAAGVAYVLGAQDRLLAHLGRRPGMALVAAGVALGAGGGSRLLGARSWRGRFLAALPERIGGLLLLVAGLMLLGAGVFELAAPDAFDAALNGLLAPLRPPV